MSELNLEVGQEVKVVIPFVYEIGDENPVTGEILRTIDDCIQAVRDELVSGLIDGYNAHIEVDNN